MNFQIYTITSGFCKSGHILTLLLKLSYLIMYINYINQASIWFLEIAIVHEVQLAKPGMHQA